MGILAGIILFVRNPDLLRKRLDVKEKENEKTARESVRYKVIPYIW